MTTLDKFRALAKATTHGPASELRHAMLINIAAVIVLIDKGIIKEADLQHEYETLEKIANSNAKAA
jgi:hypothetical protein